MYAKKLDALIVLGEAWRSYSPKVEPKNWMLFLSVESKMQALAAGELYRAGRVGTIVFSGGRTAGKQYPSEACEMYEYFRIWYPEIPENAILLEEESIDTAHQAEILRKWAAQRNWTAIAVLAAKAHLVRSIQIFTNYGFQAHGIDAMDVVIGISAHHRALISRYTRSARFFLKCIKEFILRSIVVFDPEGKLVQKLAKKMRHAEE